MRRALPLLLVAIAGCASFTGPLSPSTVQTIVDDATMTLMFADTAAGIYEAMPGNNPGIALALGLAGKQAHAALSALLAAQACKPDATTTPPVVCAPITPQSILVIALQNSVLGYLSSVINVVPNVKPPAAAARLGVPKLYPWVQ